MSNSTSESKRLIVTHVISSTQIPIASVVVGFPHPSTASPCLVKKTQGHQAKPFLLPIEAATDKVLAGWNTQTLHL
jgi:hypothetical protein